MLLVRRAERLTPLHTSHEEMEVRVKPIVQHLERLLDHEGQGCDMEKTRPSQYVLAWLSNFVRNPGHRSEVAILLRGLQVGSSSLQNMFVCLFLSCPPAPLLFSFSFLSFFKTLQIPTIWQGVGKDILFESFLIPKVLGVRACHQTEDVNTITGKHALGLENSVFVLFDEADKKNLRHSIDRLKSIMTKKGPHTINPKGKAQYSVKLMANFLFTTNNEGAIKITSDDRRFAAFECSSAM